jgi:hypothetical protein
MNRRIIYTGPIVTSLDAAQAQQFSMVGLGFLIEATMGAAAGCFGLAATATSPASMSINIGRGGLWQTTVVDETAPGTDAIQDATDPLVKMGINLGATAIAFVAPPTSGQSQDFLIQGQMLEQDGTPLVLNYYNSGNPSQPLAGPANSGSAQNTIRAQVVSLEVVAGAPASTGSQTVPSVTTGWVPLYVVTLANGATTVTTGNVAIHPNAPFVDPLGIGKGIASGRMVRIPQLISSNQTYTPPSNVSTVKVTIVGGGGGGGGAGGQGASSAAAAAGGSAGAYCESFYTAAQLAGGVAITIGAAGVGGGAGSNPGTNGSTSTFGSLMTAPGGQGGGFGVSTSSFSLSTPGGSSGEPTGYNQYGTHGEAGSNGYVFNASANYYGAGGQGGSGLYGSGGGPSGADTAGANGGGHGAGGAGACTAPSGAGYPGGNGSAGVCIIEEYT